MDAQKFQAQLNRLAETYGAQHYKRERVELLWREVKDFSDDWMTRTVDEFIGELRQAPLLREFREAASVEREKLYAEQRKRERMESERAMRNLFDGDMIGSICKTITERIEGKVPDQTFQQFTHGLNKLTAIGGCPRCSDTGLIWQRNDEGYEYCYRCHCEAGAKQPKAIPSYFQTKRGAA